MNSLLPIQEWNLNINLDRPLIISGPCSAENEQQVLDTAEKLHDIGIQIYRVGIWKPRTRPNNFEGVGLKGLSWLKEVKRKYNMLVSTEVANTRHVEQALNNNVDIIWIGARTTANPFFIQEIAEALEGVDIPVLIKNPINPDIELWYGAVERINSAGINKIGLIHRGFSSYGDTKYRNKPQWQIPIEMKKRLSNIPMICDPSHIAGDKIYIKELSQKALDLNFYGLMIESHINPSLALSDVKQQLTPEELNQLISSLIIRNINVNVEHRGVLDSIRREIDNIDREIFRLLEKRMNFASEIGSFKKENNVIIFQQERWENILSNRLEELKGGLLSDEFIIKILKEIHQESINIQTEIMNK